MTAPPDYDDIRPPPHSVPAEQALLGLLLRGPGEPRGAAWADVSGLVTPGDFWDPAHTIVANAMRTLDDMGRPCDLAMVEGALVEAGRLEDVGADYLGRLAVGAGTAENVANYAGQIRETAARRRAIDALSRGDIDAARSHLETIDSTSSVPRARLRLVCMDGMMVHRPPIRYAVEGYLPRGLVTLLGAHGGLGKSYLALAFAAHVACGRDFAGHFAYCGRALYVSLEDDEDMVLDRMRRIILAYGLDADTVKANVTILTGTHGDCALGVEGGYGKRLVATKLMDEVKAAAAGHALVVIDNASDGFGGNENDRGQVRAFMRMLADIARSTSAAVLLLAHIDKHAARNGAAGNSYSGSTAWHNSSRSRLAMAERNGAIELAQEKLNVGRKAETLALAWTKDAVLVPFEVTSAAAREAEAKTTAADAEAVLDALGAAATAGVSVPPGRVGAVTAQKALETFDELPADLRGTAGRERFWRAVTKLMTAGHVRLESYRTPDRKQRERLRAYPGCAECEPDDQGADPPCAPIRVRAPNPPIPPAHSARGCADLAVEGISCNSAQLGAERSREPDTLTAHPGEDDL